MKSDTEEALELHNSNIQMCVDYESDIYAYLRHMEVENNRKLVPDYIETIQKGVTARKRGKIVNWLVGVADEYNIASEILFLAVSYLDKFLATRFMAKAKLQLLAVTCMFIASKYETLDRPKIEFFSYITDDLYSNQDIRKMEIDILRCLDYEMGNPTAMTFLSRFTRDAAEEGDSESLNLQLQWLACYLAELSLLDYGCTRFLPSVIAASATFLANFTIRQTAQPWSLNLQKGSGYKPSDLKECVLAIHDLQLNTKGSSLKAVRLKYNQEKFDYVATMTSPLEEIPAACFEVYIPSDLKECVLAIHDLQLNTKGSSLKAVRLEYNQEKFDYVATNTYQLEEVD